jgi:lambda repressor-like predicted transcriptional regulator
MTESLERPKGPYTFADKIFGMNPYSKDDPQHATWESNARLAAEEEAIFEAELLKRTPVTPEECARYVQDGMIGHFDILARRLLIFKFRSPESIAIYEEYLAKMTKSMLTRADERCPPSISKMPFLFELHHQFRQRIAHWTAEVLKRMREGMATDRISQSDVTPSREEERKSLVMPILRERGWSILDLANESKLDFHTVKSYLSGKRKSYSSTLKKLAKALNVNVDNFPK